MDTILLETFIEVTHTRNFAKASDKLCISTSTTSARIKQLESLLGVALFERKHHEVCLTPAGERMERHARFILNAWEQAYEDTALGETEKKRLVIAGVSGLWDSFLQDKVNRLYQTQPDLILKLEESTPLRVVEKLDQGLVDIGFVYEQPNIKGLIVKEVASIPMSLVTSQPKHSLEEALGVAYVRVEWGAPFNTQHELAFPQRQLANVRANSGRIALKLILANGGAAYLPDTLVQEHLKAGRLFKVDNAPIIHMKAYAAYRMHNELKELLEEFVGEEG